MIHRAMPFLMLTIDQFWTLAPFPEVYENGYGGEDEPTCPCGIHLESDLQGIWLPG